VEWADILGFVALTMYAPDLSAGIRNAPEHFVFDGAVSVHTDKRSFDERFRSLTEPRERSTAVQRLFGFLFPAISKNRSTEDCLLDEIAFRQPLLTLLRMNVLSAAISRADVIGVTKLPRDDVGPAMATIAQAGKAVSFSERLADLVRNNIVLGSEEIWIALLKAVDEILATSWANVLMRMLALRDVSDTLLSLVSRQASSFKVDLRIIVETISQSNAFEAASILIRKILIRLQRGSSGFQAAAAKEGLDEKWIQSIGCNVVHRAKGVAQATGKLLHVGVVHLAKDIGAWDDADRAHYGQILASDDEAFDTFVMETFGGMYVTDGKTIDEMFMPLARFKERVLQRKSEINPNTAIDLRQAYDKVFEWLDVEDVGEALVEPIS
jgi:hypothetical protein